MEYEDKMNTTLKHIPKVVVYYKPCGHLHQIYDGFGLLAEQKLIDLSVVPVGGNPLKGWTYVDIDSKRVVYDCMDGAIWLDDTKEKNYAFLREHIQCDYYFKRSYSAELENYLPRGCKMYPLGLNYSWFPRGPWTDSWKEKVKIRLLQNSLVEHFHGKKIFHAKDFEYPPEMHHEHKVLFLARLWDPYEMNKGKNLEWCKAVSQINEFRIECVRALSNTFTDNFIGGLERTVYSEAHCPKDLLVSSEMSNRKNFLQKVKESDICIATTGLHNSIGWKFGEYVAASRAVVSEPLCYELPGNFVEGVNYLSASSVHEVVNQAIRLVNDELLLSSMMKANHSYYENFLRSDVLVLNTLKLIE